MADDGKRRDKGVAVGGTGCLGQRLIEEEGRDHCLGLFECSDDNGGDHCLGRFRVAGWGRELWSIVVCASSMRDKPGCCHVRQGADIFLGMDVDVQKNTLFIHLSTDQVYEGSKLFYKAEDETAPVNVYGKSKVTVEQFISNNWSNFAVLRSSIIYGPQTVSPVPKFLPIQWIDGVLSQGDAAEFLQDEFRCPVYVKDAVRVIQSLMTNWSSGDFHKFMLASNIMYVMGKQMQVLLNMGGPDRVSRAEMAEAVARVRGYITSLIKKVFASSVDLGVKSPADIPMNISKLVDAPKFSPVPFGGGIK